PYLQAFQKGLVPDSVIDASVSRVLRAKFDLGLFDDPYTNPDSAAYWAGHASHRALAREVAQQSFVLLRNEAGTLPLRPDLKSIAVIGTDAREARLGGYSGRGIGAVNILDGIRAVAGDAMVRYAPGPGRLAPTHTVVPAEALAP